MTEHGPADTAAREVPVETLRVIRQAFEDGHPWQSSRLAATHIWMCMADAGLLDVPSRPTPADGLNDLKTLIRDLGDMACIGCRGNVCAACGLAAEITNHVYRVAATDDEPPREGAGA